MPEQKTSKNFFALNKGLNTESNEINFPDGFTVDERNYELLFDGARRRRRGCSRESGGSLKASGLTVAVTDQNNSFRWRGVMGDPDKNFIVHQVGPRLFFTDDAELISTTYHADSLELQSFLVDKTETDANLGASACQFSRGRGHLFVSHPKCEPFYVTYDASGNTFNAKVIPINIRDFDGINDGLPIQSTPTSISDDHRYNLRNRGWIEADIDSFKTGSGTRYPSKNMLWFRGYRRATDVAFSDLDGIQTFNYAKMNAEKPGQSSAPQGGLFLSPTDTRYSSTSTNEGVEVAISTWVVQTGSEAAGGTIRVTTASAHGRSTNDVVNITGTFFSADTATVPFVGNIDGFWQITVVDATNFDFTFDKISSKFTAWISQYDQLGQINGNVALPKSDGKVLTEGPSAISYHSGRLFFAGINDSEWADTIFFSKIAQRAASYGICYQEADPTDPQFNALSSSDGGTIVIPNLGKVQRMLSTETSLLVFTDQGVWEIGGGQRGLFTATGYSVRKITEDECTSPYSPILLGNAAVYTGPRGIFQIAPAEFTGILEATNISEHLIQTKWNAILTARQQVVKTAYDSANKRVYFLYGSSASINANHYDRALILDLRVGAWFLYEYNNSATIGILNLYEITDADASDDNQKIKYTVQNVNNLDTCDLEQTAYLDFDGSESPLPFFLGGWDDLGGFQRRRQTPIITVHSKRTLTGFSAAGSGLDADNDSSTLMTARWDWSDLAITGKLGSTNEVYRPPRAFQPASAGTIAAVPTNDDGYPVYTTRNKVRGRGRVLQLRFEGAATKDSHLLGFSVNYKIQRAV